MQIDSPSTSGSQKRANPSTSPLIVIVGETASGKTALSIDLARRFNGEIICADSRTIYKGMDIGTAKPSTDEQAGIRHFGLDLVEPDQKFTVYDFQALAKAAIEDISARGKLPILVGGTGLYVDSILYDYSFRSPGGHTDHPEWQELSVEELQNRLIAGGIPLPENARNPRHLLRALQTKGEQSFRSELRPHSLVIGIKVDRDVLKQRISSRIDAMVAAGLIEEARKLGNAYGWDTEALKTPAYQAIHAYISNEVTLEQAKAAFAQADIHLAKRQRTWFKRNKSIHWLSNRDNLAESVDLITALLNNEGWIHTR